MSLIRFTVFSLAVFAGIADADEEAPGERAGTRIGLVSQVAAVASPNADDEHSENYRRYDGEKPGDGQDQDRGRHSAHSPSLSWGMATARY